MVYTDSGDAMIIDAGAEPCELISFASSNGLKVKYIALTHGHVDHADYVGAYISAFEDATPICHSEEIKVLTNAEANVSRLLNMNRVYDYDFTLVNDSDVITLGEYEFKILNLPGHTPGSICFYCESEKIMFTGDVLFSNTYGRTDFMYGSQADMMSSLRAISKMDREIRIYSGHGQSEQLKNIFRY